MLISLIIRAVFLYLVWRYVKKWLFIRKIRKECLSWQYPPGEETD